MCESENKLSRIDFLIQWYDSRSVKNQKKFKIFKTSEIIIAALIPISGLLDFSVLVPSILGTIILVLEGVQHLYQFNANWTRYRSTCESLRHEKYLFEAGAGPYRGIAEPRKTLAERVESLASQEHAKWVKTQEDAISKLEEQKP